MAELYISSKNELPSSKIKRTSSIFDVVVIEDFNMKGKSQTLNFNKSVAYNGYGMFTTFLQYRLEERGKQLVKIDKWFAST